MSNRFVRSGLVASVLLIALATLGGLVFSRGVGAIADPVSISSATRPVGLTGTVRLQAHDISLPALGAWEINVTYTPAVLDAISCYDLAGVASCNTHFAANTVRLVGTASAGLSGVTIDLATLDFKCRSAGVSPLTLTVELLADPNGNPVPHSIQNGTITCSLSVGGSASLPEASSGTAQRAPASSPRHVPFAALGSLAAVLVLGVSLSLWFVSRGHRAGRA